MFTQNLGYPRIGAHRELKNALESFWGNKVSADHLETVAKSIRQANWKLQLNNQIDLIPCNDFSLYDQVLDMSVMVGAIPSRFTKRRFESKYELYFAMARGIENPDGSYIPPMEMTKWFNTNYHYIVPEISPDMKFQLNMEKLRQELPEAREIGVQAVPVFIGPVTYLLLSKSFSTGFSPLGRLEELLLIYDQLFSKLEKEEIDFIQIDEPFLTTDLSTSQEKAYEEFFSYFKNKKYSLKFILTTYFGDLSENIALVSASPFEGLHVDLINMSSEKGLLDISRQFQYLSLGVIDGKNIWRTDLINAVRKVEEYKKTAPESTLIISPSCSMLHSPQDVEDESEMDPTIKSWLSFGIQKLEELKTLKEYFQDPGQVTNAFEENKKMVEGRKAIQKIGMNIESKGINQKDLYRKSPFEKRKLAQVDNLKIPMLPTTTIGSFPQTREVRSNRYKFRRGKLNSKTYTTYLKEEIQKTIHIQEDLGLDILVHGEFERNDMVQYFAERLDGFIFTVHGWVQSYGSRCVRPPIIYSTVLRKEPMTVDWAVYTQSLTSKYVKGMLTGPVTILQWSFVRDDQPRDQTCREIAFAIRDEVLDLEKNGIKIIQIDEPAFREGLPVNKKDWDDYLQWSVHCFRIASGGVADQTQIHTHMCYSEFNEMMGSIAAMDADVISIEASRSKMDLLDSFKDFKYPNEIGPGVYDIHSPCIPGESEIVSLIQKALRVIPADRLWINPDCGLKTRQWEEVIPSLKAMVKAARIVRETLNNKERD